MNLNDDIAPSVLSIGGAISYFVSLVSSSPSASRAGRMYSDDWVSRPSPPFPIYHGAEAHNRTLVGKHTISTIRISLCLSPRLSSRHPISVRCVVSARSAASKAKRWQCIGNGAIGDAMYESSDGVRLAVRLG